MTEASHFDTALESWSQFQEQWWGHWLSTSQKATTIAMEHLFNKPLGLVDDLINCGLTAQSELVRNYVKDLESEAADPTPVNKWVELNVAVARMWTDAQRQTWNTWISNVGALEPLYAAGKGADHADNMFRDFKDMTQRTLEMQTQWLSQWLPESEDAEPELMPKEAKIAQPTEDVEQAKSAA